MDENAKIITDQPVININIPSDAATISPSYPHIHIWHKSAIAENRVECDCGEFFDTLPKPKSNAGHPCEYCKDKEKLQKIAEAYISSFENSDKPSIPFIEELALKLKKHRETILNWRNKLNDQGKPEHPEFIDTIKRVESFQRLALLKRTLGRFNPTGAIFQLKTNHGFMEADKHILAGDKNEPLQITIVEEDRHVADN